MTSIRNLQDYTISRLLEAYYFRTSMRKLITKTCCINLLLYLQFFNAHKELKQPYKAIIREKQTLCLQKRSIRESSKHVLYHSSSSASHGLILSGDPETNLGSVNPDNQHIKPKSDHLPSSTCSLYNKTG